MPIEKIYCSSKDEARELIETKRAAGEITSQAVSGHDKGGWYAAWHVVIDVYSNGGAKPPKKETTKKEKTPRKDSEDEGLGD